MSTKTSDRTHLRLGTAAPAALGPASLVSVAYWLEDDLGNRISKLYASSDKPLKLAGRALDNVGSLEGWTVARRDVAGTRHVVASGTDLETLATPFLPVPTVEEAAAMRRFDEARRSMGFRRGNVVTDERVY
jgi:hypothetical protein